MSIVAWLVFLLVLILFLFVTYVFVERMYSHRLRISIEKARELIAKGVITRVVDVRTDGEWDTGHYKGAVHLPIAKINMARMVLDPTDTILVYCNTGTRARQAVLTLETMGFRNVYYIAETYHEL
jgi:phage shock protein E